MTETKRDVFDELLEISGNAMDQAMSAQYPSDENSCAPSGIGKAIRDILDPIEKRYDKALPDDLPVIPELIGKYLIMRKHDRGDLVQALDEGTSFLLDGTQWESVQDWFWFSDIKDSVDTFARAWVLGVWCVEETGEIVKLEEEK